MPPKVDPDLGYCQINVNLPLFSSKKPISRSTVNDLGRLPTLILASNQLTCQYPKTLYDMNRIGDNLICFDI